MERATPDWPAAIGRQWPLVCGLLFLFCYEFVLADPVFSSAAAKVAQFPAAAALFVIVVLAPRRPFAAALVAAAAVVVSSVAVGIGDLPVLPTFISKLLVTEIAALLALIAILVHRESTSRAAIGVTAIVAASASTWWLRPDFQAEFGGVTYSYDPNLRISLEVGGALLLVSIGASLYLRLRNEKRRRSVEAEVLAAQHAERMALARELHDVVAHYVTSIVVHSQAAEAVLELNPDAAREVLPVITNSGTEALAAMRKLVGTLRGSEPAGSGSVGSTSNLAADVGAVTEESGLPVHLEFDLTEQVPPEFERSVLRLVQESLTNSRKHATDVTRVEVSVSAKQGAVHIRVADNGRGTRQAPVGGSGGYGLVGMRERVELLGGTFTAGARSGDGWEVRALIPITP